MFERYFQVHSVFHGCQFWMTKHLIVGTVFQSLLIFGDDLFFLLFWTFFGKDFFFPLLSFRTFRRNKELCHRRNTQLQPLEQDSSSVFDWIFCSEHAFLNFFLGFFLFFCCWSLKYPSLKGNLGIMDPALVWCLSVSIIWGGRAWKSHSPLHSLFGRLFCLVD